MQDVPQNVETNSETNKPVTPGAAADSEDSDGAAVCAAARRMVFESSPRALEDDLRQTIL